MKKRIGFFVGCFLLLGSTCSLAAGNTAEIACAKFARNGELAEITIRNGDLRLQLVGAGTSQDPPTQQVSSAASNCELFFSADSQWLALGTEHAVKNSWSVRVHVWDVRRSEWHGHFDVDPRPGLTGYVSLAGFFQKENKLIITGRQDDTRDAPLTSMLVNIEGKELDGPGYPRESPAVVDAERDRVWSSKGTDGCTMSSASLIGNLVKGPGVNRPAIQGNCAGPSPVGFPGQNTIIGAASDGDGRTWAWSVSVDANKSNKISLAAAPSKDLADKWVQATLQPFLSISPDEQVFVVQRTSAHWSHFDNPRAIVNDLIVAGVEPLRLLQVVRPKSCSSVSAIAVNHQVGNVEVVGRWCGEWKTDTLVIPQNSGNRTEPEDQTQPTPTTHWPICTTVWFNTRLKGGLDNQQEELHSGPFLACPKTYAFRLQTFLTGIA
jgi:hypothetical protein